jgi:putative SOS response-associated peptidase YedK
MCGRFTLTDIAQMPLRFGLDDSGEPGDIEFAPKYNIAPSQQILTIREQAEHRVLLAMRWGFAPAWMTTHKGAPPINARAETLLERPMFRSAVTHSRCLIPADGFYEWQIRPGTKTKQPMYIKLKDGSLFAFAGIHTKAADGQQTCAIITTSPNALVENIHNRMPVILSRESETAWLDPDLTDPEYLMPMLQPFPAELMEAYPVSSLVGSPHNDTPELIVPLTAG